MGMTSDEYWFGDPSMIYAFQEAYTMRQKTRIQELWMQGQYFGCAIQSTISFKEGTRPKYPEMPFSKEVEEEMAHDEEWVKKEREKAFNHFAMILSRKR